MNPLICTIPFCNSDHASAARLLHWIGELDGKIVDHPLVLVADDAVPMDTKKAIRELGRSIFKHVECILLKAPASVNGNYHVPAAFMFERAASHIDTCYKWPWVWVEPDAVPLKPGWLDALSAEYDACPRRFMGAVITTNQADVPQVHMPATMVYPNCAHQDLKKFCDGTNAFDMAFAPYVVPRGQNTPLIFHRFGQINEPPRFKSVKMEGDGPNVGTLSSMPQEAVLFHRNKDGSLIELLREAMGVDVSGEPQTNGVEVSTNPFHTPDEPSPEPEPLKRRPGRPPKLHPATTEAL